MLRRLPKQVSDRILIGLETPDDAGVILLDEERALIQTLDFFTPIVDDPFTYGQIAAANSLSDVYAMGGEPLTAMSIVCYPFQGEGALPPEWLAEILRGGAEKIAESGALLVGGHTVNDPTIKFGLSVTGLAHPQQITATRGARAGDRLVLTKALGTGLVTTALKRRLAGPEEVEAVVASMRALNAAAGRAAARAGVHAATDITGFGFLGHLGEMLEQSGVAAEVEAAALPFLPGALAHAAAGVDTGGGRATRAYLGDRVRFADDVPEAVRVACCDPQTSGGLLLSVAEARLQSLLAALEAEGAPVAAVVGRITAGPPGTCRVA